jgi:hypothetical protein
VQPTLRSRTRNDCATSGRYETKHSCGRIDKRSKMSLGLKEYALTSSVADTGLGGVTTILGHDCSAVTKVFVVIKGTSESWEGAAAIEIVGDRGVEQLAQ